MERKESEVGADMGGSFQEESWAEGKSIYEVSASQRMNHAKLLKAKSRMLMPAIRYWLYKAYPYQEMAYHLQIILKDISDIGYKLLLRGK